MLFYYFVLFIVSNRYLLFWVSNGRNSVTVQNRTHVYMNFFDHKDLGNHLLQLCPKVVKHPVYYKMIHGPYNIKLFNLTLKMRIPCRDLITLLIGLRLTSFVQWVSVWLSWGHVFDIRWRSDDAQTPAVQAFSPPGGNWRSSLGCKR